MTGPRLRSPEEAIEHLADEAMKNPATIHKVETLVLVDGKPATPAQMQELQTIQEREQEVAEAYIARIMRVHRRALGWLALRDQVEARHQKLVGI